MDRQQTVREIYEAINRGDFEWLRAHAHEDFRWLPNPDDPEQRVHEGWDEAERGLRAIRGFVEEMRSEIETIEERGDSVICAVHHTARLVEAAGPIERREVHVWTFRGDKVATLQEFADIETVRSTLGT